MKISIAFPILVLAAGCVAPTSRVASPDAQARKEYLYLG
jgi:hypothetical protein